MRGLLMKGWRESRFVIAGTSVALMIVTGALTAILPQLQSGLNEILVQLPFIQTFASALMGIDVTDGFTPQMMLALAWTHPVVLAIVWGTEIVLCTRTPAGEIDRGTAELLLGWPVSRWSIWVAETMIWLLAGSLLVLGGIVGYAFSAQWIEPAQRPEVSQLALVQINLFCLYLAVGGLSFLVSAFHDRRGRAMTVVIGILLASFLLNFLAQFWSPAQAVVFLSVSNYYQPAQILLLGTLPMGDVVVLASLGIITWTAGLFVWMRRDVRVV